MSRMYVRVKTDNIHRDKTATANKWMLIELYGNPNNYESKVVIACVPVGEDKMECDILDHTGKESGGLIGKLEIGENGVELLKSAKVSR